MDMYSVKKLFIAALLLMAAGCGPVISENVLKNVDRDIEFKSVVDDPARYEGKSVVFGGTIIKVENLEGATVMEVVQEGMNSPEKG
jgi:starvation-inducible outer membrane lipoprotein